MANKPSRTVIAVLLAVLVALILAVVVVTTGVFGTSGIATGSDWTQLHPATTPGPRSQPAAAYDGATGQLLLFGGKSSRVGNTAGTWAWTGTVWKQQHVATSPPLNLGASMAYDAATHQVVMFGGVIDQESQYSSATWLWNGTDWSRAPSRTSPPGRNDAARLRGHSGTGAPWPGRFGQIVPFGPTIPTLCVNND
jgi:hypothetical protein